MSRPSPDALVRYFRRLGFVLLGTALAVALALADVALASTLWAVAPAPVTVVAIIALVVVPPVLIGLVPAARAVEVVAVEALLRPSEPVVAGPSRTASQRRRTAGWVLAHLVAGGLLALVLLLLLPIAVDALVRVLRGAATLPLVELVDVPLGSAPARLATAAAALLGLGVVAITPTALAAGLAALAPPRWPR